MAKTRSRRDLDLSAQQYLDSLQGKDYEPLSREEETELFDRVRAGDQEAFWKVARANLRFVVSVANLYACFWHGPFAELVSEANEGLFEAIRRFDNTRGYKFISYAVWWVRRAIFLVLGQQRSVRIPENRIKDLHTLEKRVQEFIEENDRFPSMEEVRDLTGFTELQLVGALVGTKFTDSLDANIHHNDEPRSLLDVLPANAPNPLNEVIEQERCNIVRRVVARLDNRRRVVIESIFGFDEDDQPKTLDEIGLEIGFTREYIRQLRVQALTKLRFWLRKEDIHGSGRIDELALMRFRKSHREFRRRRDIEANRERWAIASERNQAAGKIHIDFSDKHPADVNYGNGHSRAAIVKEYEGYVRQAIEIGNSYDYLLTFSESEDIEEGRRFLRLASENVGQRIVIRKVSGQNILRFHLLPDNC